MGGNGSKTGTNSQSESESGSFKSVGRDSIPGDGHSAAGRPGGRVAAPGSGRGGRRQATGSVSEAVGPQGEVCRGETRDEFGPLPSGWKTRFHESGRRFYYNRGKDVTSWNSPNEGGGLKNNIKKKNTRNKKIKKSKRKKSKKHKKREKLKKSKKRRTKMNKRR